MYFEKLHPTIGAKGQGIDLSILSDDNISEKRNSPTVVEYFLSITQF